MAHAEGAPIPAEVYREAAALRAGLRRFLRRSEEIAAANGLTPRRQLLLLLIKGAPDGSEEATVTDLSERLQLAQNTVTELARRAEEAGLITRRPSEEDGRSAHLRLTEEGERRLAGTIIGLRADRRSLIALVGALDGSGAAGD